MQSKKGVFILFIMILITTNCWTQDPAPSPPSPPPPAPAPPLDPNPLERPLPLSIMKIDTNFILLDLIADTLESYKFNIVRRDDKEEVLEAKRVDTPDSKDHDKVLIWLERDFQEPQKYVKIFLQYGRYLKIWSDVKRIKVDPDEETERIGKLKKAIISISKLKR